MAEGRRLPLRGSMVADRQRSLDIVDQLRVAVPQDVREASEVLQARDQLLAQAREEAQQMLTRAEADRQRRVEEHELTRQAQERARQIVQEAEERAKALLQDAEAQARARLDEAMATAQQQMADADIYALQSLRRLESQMHNFLETVRRGIETFEGKRR
ncbi:MAG: hypothetical protein ACE5IZ_01615 [Dehalococcoidia bacterium]